VDDVKQAKVLRALLSRGALLTPVLIEYPQQPTVRGYQLYLNRLAEPLVIGGSFARELENLNGVTVADG